MAKKSFIDESNPALQFISQTGTADELDEATPREQPQPVQVKRKATPAGYKPDPAYIECKTRRVQLILQQSLYNRIKAAAQAAGISVNEYVSQVLDQTTPQ